MHHTNMIDGDIQLDPQALREKLWNVGYVKFNSYVVMSFWAKPDQALVVSAHQAIALIVIFC